MVIILVIFVVAILVLGVLADLLLPVSSSSSNVIVTGINFYSADDACGLNGATDTGFNASTNQSIEFTYSISGNNTTSGGTAPCEIENIGTTTAGFTVTGANTPLVVPANSSVDFSFAVNTPPDPYTGVLTLVLT